MKFAKRYNGSAIDLEFRDEFLVYLRDIGRFTGIRNRIK